MTVKYVWYEIGHFATSVTDKYDETKDHDLQMLCSVIPDFVFVIFKLKSTGTSMFLRVPKEYACNVDSIISFGTELLDFPRCTEIESLMELKLREKSIFPLPAEKETHRDIFSMSPSELYGVFCIKLLHAKSDIIKRQFDMNRKKFENKKSTDTNFYEKMTKSKSEQSIFFHAEIFFGCSTKDVGKFQSIIPYAKGKPEPNSLVKKKLVSAKHKDTEKVTTLLKKKFTSESKKTQMILSGVDILPFVCFSKHPEHQQIKSAQNKLYSSSYSTIQDVPDPQSLFEESK